jgi:hypothetical protein
VRKAFKAVRVSRPGRWRSTPTVLGPSMTVRPEDLRSGRICSIALGVVASHTATRCHQRHDNVIVKVPDANVGTQRRVALESTVRTRPRVPAWIDRPGHAVGAHEF